MSWLERPEQKQKNPAKKFLEWKSEEQCFMFYNKETEQNEKVELPLNMVIIEHYHTVKGWDDKNESSIYSNEVFAIGTDPLTVKSFGSKKANTQGRTIGKGLYKDIKNEVKAEGAHYSRSIYAVTSNLELINISLKGSGVQSYSDFVNNVLNGDHNFDKQWVKITGAEERKKGKVTYSVPVFEKGQEIKDKSKLNPFAKELQEYMIAYTGDSEKVLNTKVNDAKVVEAEEEEDLPF